MIVYAYSHTIQILHTIAPNLYPNWREATMNALMLQQKSPNYADTKTGRAIAYSSAAVMIIIGNKILKKWRDNPDQTAREYLYRFLSIFQYTLFTLFQVVPINC